MIIHPRRGLVYVCRCLVDEIRQVLELRGSICVRRSVAVIRRNKLFFFVASVLIFTGDRQNPRFSRQETQVATTKPEEESQTNLGIISWPTLKTPKWEKIKMDIKNSPTSEACLISTEETSAGAK